MKLTEESARTLCCYVIKRLAEWPLLPAVLQVGGIESRASSRILLAIESWLTAYEKRTDLLVLPEYRLSKSIPPDERTDSEILQAADRLLHGRIDYAIVQAQSVGQPSLVVDTVFEVKTNYLCQSDLRKRPMSACDQANVYGRACGSPAYVLYIVASPIGTPPSQPRDAGWNYYREARPQITEAGPISVDGVRVLGQYPTGNKGHQVSINGTELWACVLTSTNAQPVFATA